MRKRDEVLNKYSIYDKSTTIGDFEVRTFKANTKSVALLNTKTNTFRVIPREVFTNPGYVHSQAIYEALPKTFTDFINANRNNILNNYQLNKGLPQNVNPITTNVNFNKVLQHQDKNFSHGEQAQRNLLPKGSNTPASQRPALPRSKTATNAVKSRIPAQQGGLPRPPVTTGQVLRFLKPTPLSLITGLGSFSSVQAAPVTPTDVIKSIVDEFNNDLTVYSDTNQWTQKYITIWKEELYKYFYATDPISASKFIQTAKDRFDKTALYDTHLIDNAENQQWLQRFKSNIDGTIDQFEEAISQYSADSGITGKYAAYT